MLSVQVILIAHLFISSNIVSGILFFYGFSETTDWNSALSNCQCTSQLATWDSQSEYDTIKTAKANAGAGDVWIGLTDQSEEGKWRFIDGNSDYCDDYDGTDCDNIPQWTSGEPSGDGDVAELWGNGLLNDVHNSNLNGFVCEFKCGNNKFFGAFTKAVNWETANNHCATFNTRLATFGSQSEYDLIKNAKNNAGASAVWIGLTDKDNEGKWKFIDGDSGYCNQYGGDCDNLPQWIAGEPNDAGCEGEDYAVLHSHGINDEPNSAQHGYVCQFEGGDGGVGFGETIGLVHQPQPYSYPDISPLNNYYNSYILEFTSFKDIAMLISIICNAIFIVICIISGIKNKTKSKYSKVKMYTSEEEHL